MAWVLSLLWWVENELFAYIGLGKNTGAEISALRHHIISYLGYEHFLEY